MKYDIDKITKIDDILREILKIENENKLLNNENNLLINKLTDKMRQPLFEGVNTISVRDKPLTAPNDFVSPELVFDAEKDKLYKYIAYKRSVSYVTTIPPDSQKSYSIWTSYSYAFLKQFFSITFEIALMSDINVMVTNNEVSTNNNKPAKVEVAMYKNNTKILGSYLGNNNLIKLDTTPRGKPLLFDLKNDTISLTFINYNTEDSVYVRFKAKMDLLQELSKKAKQETVKYLKDFRNIITI
ncbi:MAG: hypothetical protein ACTSRP_15685 [Candidatus Helarchaeota archaeon]